MCDSATTLLIFDICLMYSHVEVCRNFKYYAISILDLYITSASSSIAVAHIVFKTFAIVSFLSKILG